MKGSLLTEVPLYMYSISRMKIYEADYVKQREKEE